VREQGKYHTAEGGGHTDQRAGKKFDGVVKAHGVVTFIKMPLVKTSVFVAPPTTVI
jgi:hypothetical protein